MKLAEGLERKMMESATSSGVAARFKGVMVEMACPISGLTLTQSCTTAVIGVSDFEDIEANDWQKKGMEMDTVQMSAHSLSQPASYGRVSRGSAMVHRSDRHFLEKNPGARIGIKICLLGVSTQPGQTALTRILLCRARESMAVKVCFSAAGASYDIFGGWQRLTGRLHNAKDSVLSRRVGDHARRAKVRLRRAEENDGTSAEGASTITAGV